MKNFFCVVPWMGWLGVGVFFLFGCAQQSAVVLESSSGQTMFSFALESSSGRSMSSFFSRLKEGDRHVGWALTYFESWQRGQQPRYLLLAEDHIYTAVNEFALLQADTSPRINEFYVVRERRVRSCRFLAELKFSATNYGLALRYPTAAGCVF